VELSELSDLDNSSFEKKRSGLDNSLICCFIWNHHKICMGIFSPFVFLPMICLGLLCHKSAMIFFCSDVAALNPTVQKQDTVTSTKRLLLLKCLLFRCCSSLLFYPFQCIAATTSICVFTSFDILFKLSLGHKQDNISLCIHISDL